jgi:hypothetical protein
VRLLRNCVLDQQALKMVYADFARAAIDLLQDLRQHFAPFINGKEGLLFRMDQDGYDDFIKEFAATLDDVEMSIGDWIE